MRKLAFIAASLLVATTVAASANSTSYDRRQDQQFDRIERGRQTGQITWREGLKLRAEQRRVSALERYFLADGYLDKRERRILRAAQDDAADHIWSEKSDGWRRPRWLPRFGR